MGGRESGVRVVSGLCRDCRYWTVLIEEGTHGECQLIRSNEHGDSDTDDWKALPQYAAGAIEVQAYLLTTHDFGCVQFEARPTAPEGKDTEHVAE